MAAASVGRSLSSITVVLCQRSNVGYLQSCPFFIPTRHYAARKGTREKAKKKKVKKEIKVGFIPYNLRVKKEEIIPFSELRDVQTNAIERIDDVWIEQFHKRRIYTFEEAIQCHRETHHPSMYSSENAFVQAFIELNMQGERVTKLVEKFTRVVDIPNPFDHGETRTIIAFAKEPALLDLADKAGAALTGDKLLIRQIQSGEIVLNDYQYVVAHPDIMPDLSVIRGLLKRKFPSPRAGTLGLNLPALIKKIYNGIKYTALPYGRQKQYGTASINFGRLNMDIQQLKENFAAVVKDVETARPKKSDEFVFRTSIQSWGTTESLQVDFEKYITEVDEPDSDDEDENVISNVA